MQNYKITVQYDGSRYKGWQRLKPEDGTIQGKLEEILFKLDGEPVEVIGSGRTDAGVHAEGQVANFHLRKEDITPKELLRYFNRYLPDDIAVTSVEAVDERFHARFNATSKTYRYRIRTTIVPDVFRRKYLYTYLDGRLNVNAMKRAAKDLVGKHDFYSFCGNSHMKKSSERTIFSIDITEASNEITIDVTGDGFLQNMVRIIVGTLIEVGTGKRDADSLPKVLSAFDRSKAGFMAPAHGLSLIKVEY